MGYDIITGRNVSDKEAFGKKGLVLIGKGYVKMGQYTSMSNRILMDVARSHVILVAGKRGCLTEETMVFTDKGYKQIKDFDEKQDKVFSFNKEKKEFEWEKAELLKYPMKNEKLLQIELKDGRIINLTKEHPLLSSYGKYQYYRRACDLKIRDKIILPTSLPEIKKDKESLRIARLLGFILADGNIGIKKGRFKDGRGKWYNGTKARIRIYNACEEVLIQAKKDFEKEFKIVAKRYKRNDCNCEVVETKHQKIANKFIKLGIPKGLKSGIIRIPKIVFESSNKFKAEFISALFDCDGYIEKKGRNIDYSSKSRKFLEDLQILLTHFNIESVIRIKNAKLNGKIFKNYRLFITDNVSIENFKKISFKNPFKQERLEKHKAYNTRKRKTHYPSKDLVCIRIQSIKEISGIKEVYDLSVDKNHSFIANGIISHNSGKSYTLGVIAEELSNLPREASQNIASLIFDTMGIFWTMKYKNEKDKALLQEWDLKPKDLPIKVFVPYGHYDAYLQKGIPVDEKFALDVSEMNSEDWVLTFGLDIINPVSILIQRTITKLKEQGNFGLNDIISNIENDSKTPIEIKNAAAALFEAADTWGIFAKGDEKPTQVKDLITAGKTSILDLSAYNSVGTFNVRALVISLVSRKIFNQRMDARKKEEIKAISTGLDYLSQVEKKEDPLVWIFIDECLAGNTEIITDKAHTPIQEIVKRFEKGEEFKVLGFNEETNNYNHFKVQKVYKKGKRKVIKIITETGREITCTPEHRVLTSKGCFASAFSVNDIAFPLFQHYSENLKLIEVRILGHLFGDGWVTDKQQSIGFSGKGNKQDLEKIRKDLLKLGFSSTNIYERKTTSKINHKGKIINVVGTSQSFTSSRPAYKYFRKKIEFAGTKTIHPTKIPDWLIKSSNLEKAEFLAALMGSDGQIITSAKNAKGDFNAIRFSFNKIESLEKEAFEFANQIKKLFEDLGIKISNISKKEGNLRKDGNKTIKIIITLEKNVENTIKFLEKIGYRYCSYKELEGLKWLEYLKARFFLKKQREKIKDKALELKAKGLGKTKISRELNFPEAQIRDWIYSPTSPGLPKSFPDFDEWIKNRKKENILFEKIFKIEEVGEEEVYDISVDKVHNFVSNNLITHNCHEFLPKQGKTIATDALVQLLREGRQPGISLVLATQQPGQIHRDVMTQSDIVISHRVTSAPDLEALNQIMQSYLLDSIKQYMDDLPTLKGSAIILDDNSERIYPMRMRPRFTWHGGEAPTAIKAEKRL